jgi:polyphosphate glucokinase
MELAHLPWRKHKTYEDYLGKAGLQRSGPKKWEKNVLKVIELMSTAMETDYVVLGGGNAKLVKNLPNKVFLGSNDNAFKGAFMLWQNKKK